MTRRNKGERRIAVCIRNTGYPVSLEVRKIYQVIPDPVAAKHHQIRIIDESGQDYLYPERYFVMVELPQSLENALLVAS